MVIEIKRFLKVPKSGTTGEVQSDNGQGRNSQSN